MRFARSDAASLCKAAATLAFVAPIITKPALSQHCHRRLRLSRPTMSSQTPVAIGIDALMFESTLTKHLSPDPSRVNEPRPVLNAAFSFVRPTHPAEDDAAAAWGQALHKGMVKPTDRGDPVLGKALIAWSPSCAALFDLAEGYPSAEEEVRIIDVLGGFGSMFDGMEPHALCYGGHQFGNWAGQLGDGRAISLGEFLNDRQQRWEIQLKGAGKTPYSRFADGRAVMRSSVREFLCSESMFFLGVPTTRALSLVSTGAGVIRDMFYSGDPRMEAGAVVARVAPSFLRLGNFQLPASRGDLDLLKEAADYAIDMHFPQFGHLSDDKSSPENKYVAFVREVARLNAEMVAMWQAIGFVHGVMNTDNFSILGLTIDYGPYGFLDAYDPEYTPNTTDIPGKRYKFDTQPLVANWNIAQFAKAMTLLCPVEPLQEIVQEFEDVYKVAENEQMRKKLGFNTWKGDDDKEILNKMLELMQKSKADFTNTWRSLAQVSAESTSDELRQWLDGVTTGGEGGSTFNEEWMAWLLQYQKRIQHEAPEFPSAERVAMMNKTNPVYILRNYMAQVAIEMADIGDYSEVRRLYELLSDPYTEQEGMERYTQKPPTWSSRKGVSVNSCSS